MWSTLLTISPAQSGVALRLGVQILVGDPFQSFSLSICLKWYAVCVVSQSRTAADTDKDIFDIKPCKSCYVGEQIHQTVRARQELHINENPKRQTTYHFNSLTLHGCAG